MRVLWVTNMWPDERRPWYGSFVFSQAQSLRVLGVDLDVIYIPGYLARAEYARAVGKMRQKLRSEVYDVVHAHYGHSAMIARLQTKVPLVISYCGDDLLGTPMSGHPNRLTLASRILAEAFAQLARLAAATITKSEAMRERLPLPARRRNHVIPNGVDLVRFTPIPPVEARRALGWSGEVPNVLFLGDPTNPRKNFDLAAEVCAELACRGRPVELRTGWGISPDQIPTWLNASDVLLFPSLSEGSPNSVKEAMAVELPIVSAPVGDVPERLRGIPGGFIAERAVAPMADAVAAALEVGRSPALREAVLPLSSERIAQRVVDVYEMVIRRPCCGFATAAHVVAPADPRP